MNRCGMGRQHRHRRSPIQVADDEDVEMGPQQLEDLGLLQAQLALGLPIRGRPSVGFNGLCRDIEDDAHRGHR
ncbi:MAG TPA: hypothetical protein EYO90_12340 [Candidatus Latescibacteria bacterium]|nr:hypothetical protein [Candidatus Latescibacterota bacterium]